MNGPWGHHLHFFGRKCKIFYFREVDLHPLIISCFELTQKSLAQNAKLPLETIVEVQTNSQVLKENNIVLSIFFFLFQILSVALWQLKLPVFPAIEL